MPNIYEPKLDREEGWLRARIGDEAGCDHLGVSLYELAPGERLVFHYHVQREEFVVVLSGRVALRTAVGWDELDEGELVSFPRGERGAHGFENRSGAPVRLLVVSEMTGPNISVYPDTDQIGVFDAGRRSDRRFGALFNVADAVSDYGRGKAAIVPPAPPPPTRPTPSDTPST